MIEPEYLEDAIEEINKIEETETKKKVKFKKRKLNTKKKKKIIKVNELEEDLRI